MSKQLSRPLERFLTGHIDKTLVKRPKRSILPYLEKRREVGRYKEEHPEDKEFHNRRLWAEASRFQKDLCATFFNAINPYLLREVESSPISKREVSAICTSYNMLAGRLSTLFAREFTESDSQKLLINQAAELIEYVFYELILFRKEGLHKPEIYLSRYSYLDILSFVEELSNLPQSPFSRENFSDILLYSTSRQLSIPKIRDVAKELDELFLLLRALKTEPKNPIGHILAANATKIAQMAVIKVSASETLEFCKELSEHYRHQSEVCEGHPASSHLELIFNTVIKNSSRAYRKNDFLREIEAIVRMINQFYYAYETGMVNKKDAPDPKEFVNNILETETNPVVKLALQAHL